MTRLTALCVLALFVAAAAASAARAGAKYDAEEDRKMIEKAKKEQQAYQKAENERIAKVILEQQRLDSSKARQLQTVHEASLGLQPIIDTEKERAARTAVMLRDTNDPGRKQPIKEALIQTLNREATLSRQKKQFDEVIDSSVPTAQGKAVASPRYEQPQPVRSIPPLGLPDVRQLSVYRQAEAVNETLSKLKRADIESDLSSSFDPLVRPTNTEGLLQRLDQPLGGSAPHDLPTALRNLHGQKRQILTEHAALRERIAAHNREVNAYPIPRDDPRYEGWAAPLRTRAGELAGEQDALLQRLDSVYSEIDRLRNNP